MIRQKLFLKFVKKKTEKIWNLFEIFLKFWKKFRKFSEIFNPSSVFRTWRGPVRFCEVICGNVRCLVGPKIRKKNHAYPVTPKNLKRGNSLNQLIFGFIICFYVSFKISFCEVNKSHLDVSVSGRQRSCSPNFIKIIISDKGLCGPNPPKICRWPSQPEVMCLKNRIFHRPFSFGNTR